MSMFEVHAVSCKSALNKSKIFDYCINPYVGCQHACVYCYAMFMSKYRGREKESWGSWVEVKTNVVEQLEKQIKKAKPGVIWLSSVTDPYQPIEKQYGLTRKILELLLQYEHPISIQTKSALVLRDLDLLTQYKECQVGLTISLANDADRRLIEPFASPIDDRWEALKQLKQHKIKTYVFLGPVFPYLSDRSLDSVFARLAGCADRVYVDRLNIKSGNWKYIAPIIQKQYKEKYEDFRKAVFDQSPYYQTLKRTIQRLAAHYAVEVEYCY